MKIPNFVETQFVDKDGNLTPIWKQTMMQLFQELQNNASNEGIKIPQQDTANIAVLNNSKSTGALIYDADNHKLKVNLNGTFKEIQIL